jgi:hypothetical protein
VEALEDRSLLSPFAAPFDITGLTLSNASVYEFRPTGTAVGTFTTTEPGSGHTFSYELQDDTGSFTIPIGGNQLLTADAFDFAAKASYSIRVRSTDEAGNALVQPFTITVLDDPALTRFGPTLAVTTDYKFNPNTFSLSLTADPVRYGMTLNGVSLAVDTASVDMIVFHGPNMEVPGPPVIATLTGGTSLNTAELRPARARLMWTGHQVSVANVSEISVIGESYTALFYGSPGDYPDWFGAMPGDAHMYGPMPSDPLMYGVGYHNKAFGFKTAVAVGSANSRSEASLYTGGEGDFVATPTYGYITAPGYYIQASGFQTVNAYPSDSFNAGGPGTAYFYDSAGNATFEGDLSSSSLSGPGSFRWAHHFRRAYAYATAGVSDTALLYDSPGSDTFVATPTYSYLTGTDQNADGAFGDFLNFVTGFKTVVASAGAGGSDTALFYDAAGNDTLVGTPTYAYVRGAGYYNQASGFQTVVAAAGAGDSASAYLYDSAGPDTFVATPAYGYLRGTGFYVQASGFAAVYAYATAHGSDAAYLYDAPGTDTFAATADSAYLSGPGYCNQAIGFQAAYAFASGGSDRAYLYGTGTAADTFGQSGSWAYLYGNLFADATYRFGYVYVNPNARH